MTDTRNIFAAGFSGRASRVVRDILAALIALAVVGLVIFLAAMLTAAFLVVAGIAVLAAAGFWVWRKLRGGRVAGTGARSQDRPSGPEILVATRGPEGWTVDGVGPTSR
ncbi:hypothetical protein [Maricaulis sp.]|uniref:hypothetical protein n=1 Tax=Maricaulis sp. TaxID=1486257 RepID=UPI002B26AABB|nr:hypothetical protein [Maricaulis sp.]